MELMRAGSQPSRPGPTEFFTGTVRIDPLNAPPPPARVACASVTFEPGARTAWHTHPLGQTLLVTFGCGWTQCEGEPIAIQEALDGKNVEWLQKVTDAEYLVGPSGEAAHIHGEVSP